MLYRIIDTATANGHEPWLVPARFPQKRPKLPSSRMNQTRKPGNDLLNLPASGIPHAFGQLRRGPTSSALPCRPGMAAAAGIVVPIIKSLRLGDRVAYTDALGACAELALVPADRTVPVPKGLGFELAAACILQGMTTHYLVTDTRPLAKGDVVLVHAAAGGAGLLLVQMARMRGAAVIATVSIREKAERARGAGANEVILYSEQDFVAETRRLPAGKGVRAVFDSVGKDTFMKSVDCLAPRGMIVLFGQSSGKVEGVDPSILQARGSPYLTRPTLGHYVMNTKSLRDRAAVVFGWVAGGKLSVRVGARFPLADAAEAHRQMEARKTTGKVILAV